MLNGVPVPEGQTRAFPGPLQGAVSVRGPTAQAPTGDATIRAGAAVVRIVQACDAAGCRPSLGLWAQLSQMPSVAVRGVLGDAFPPQLGGKPVRRRRSGRAG